MEEVSDLDAFEFDMMVNYCAGNVHELGTGHVQSNPDREFGFLTSQRKNAQPTHLSVEGAELVKKVPTEGHCGPDEVANGSDRFWQSGVATTDYPIEQIGRASCR